MNLYKFIHIIFHIINYLKVFDNILFIFFNKLNYI